jgi:2-phospho-L-lactate guanylyltransferase (CobY/MobA/RfbA family)
MRPEPGLNAALEAGIETLAPGPEEAMLIVLGDVAGALSEDFTRLLAEAEKRATAGVWLAPSSDGGTCALLQRPAGVIPCRFGRDSAKRHREACEEAHVPHHEMRLASLAIDLDEPEDLEAFLATAKGGRRTRALLTSLPRAGKGGPR